MRNLIDDMELKIPKFMQVCLFSYVIDVIYRHNIMLIFKISATYVTKLCHSTTDLLEINMGFFHPNPYCSGHYFLVDK